MNHDRDKNSGKGAPGKANESRGKPREGHDRNREGIHKQAEATLQKALHTPPGAGKDVKAK